MLMKLLYAQVFHTHLGRFEEPLFARLIFMEIARDFAFSCCERVGKASSQSAQITKR